VVRTQEVDMEATQFVVVTGPVPATLSRTLLERFEDVRVTANRSHTVIECSLGDQSALRALLTQLWDAGADVLLVSQVLTHSPRSHHGHDHP
jgi:hypothetical protein